MKKFVKIFSLLLLAVISKSFGQSLSTGTIEAGPYGKGSTIAVPVTLSETSGYYRTDNIFKLYLSDATGNFANETEIGSYTGFYTTFINGTIPATAAPGNYRVRIKSTKPALVSAESNFFTINSTSGVQASLDAPAQQTLGAEPNKAFGYCTPGRANLRFNFTNTSTAGAAVSASFQNAVLPEDRTDLSFTSSPQQFIPANISHYTITVKAELNGVIGTKAYFLINNRINTPFNPPGSSTICLPAGSLSYNVETSSTNGIQLNFPGNQYKVIWGDGSTESFTFGHIKLNGGLVSHLYSRSSCGSQITIGSVRYYNVFGIIIQTQGVYCGDIGVPVSSYAKVITQPENRFVAPAAVCTNSPTTFANGSIAGEDPSSTSPSCQNNNVVYYWYVDNVLVTPGGVPLSYQLKYTFTTPGLHTIRLESESTSECQAPPVEKKVYVQPPPAPGFQLSKDTYCLGEPVKPLDKTTLDTNPLATYSYNWIISGPAAPAYSGGTTASSKNPEINFTKAGTYTIKLSLSSVCATVTTAEETIIVNQTPAISTAWKTNLCGKGQLLTFNSVSGNPVATSFSGTTKDLPDTYSWTISGGAYSFENGSGKNSKFPSVLFKDYGSYNVSVTHSNNCGTTTETHTITFNESPTINAGEDQFICAGNAAILAGTITGPPALSYEWKGGTGTFLPGRNVLNPKYTPSAAEIASGKTELILSALTTNPAPCDKVEDVVVLTINAVNRITSADRLSTCTESPVNYRPVALLEGSTITWTASGSANATGYRTAGTGDITDVIVNTSNSQEATVTYAITPEINGCKGDTFIFTVTVTPVPVVVPAPGNPTICTNQPAGISLSSSLQGSRYRWTSKATGTVIGNTEVKEAVAVTSIDDVLINTGTTAGTVTYTITPISSGGCEGTPVTVSINVAPAPVRAKAGQDEKLCNATTFTLKGNAPGTATGRWTLVSGQTGVTFDDDSRFDAVVSGLKPGETYRFLWTISGPFNCQPSNDEVVIQSLKPISLNTITAATSVLCQGSEIDISGSLPSGGDGSYTYIWEISGNAADWNTVAGAGERSLKLPATDTVFFRRIAISENCTNYSNVLKISVQKGISRNVISSDQQVCNGAVPALLTGSAPKGGDGSYSYQWQKSGDNGYVWSNVANGNSKDYQPVPLAGTTLYRRLVSSSLCNGQQQSISNSVTVKVLPPAEAAFVWNSDSFCAPFNITDKTLRAVQSAEGDTYTWFANGKEIGTGMTFPGFTLNNPGDSVEIRLNVAGSFGCGIATFSHTFRAIPSFTTDFKTDKTNGCGPLLVNFTNLTNEQQGLTFTWDFGNGTTSSLRNPLPVTFEARADGKDTVYTVMLTAASPCASSTRKIDIKVTGPAIASFAPDKTTGCSPLTISFKNNTKGSSNTFTWDFGDGSPLLRTNTAEPVSHTFTSSKPGLYTVSLTVENECGKDESKYVIKLSPNTVFPKLTVNGNEYEGCAPHTVHFINNTAGATTYTYDFGDGSSPYTTNNQTSISHTFVKGGKYSVRLTASNGCSDSSAVETITVNPQAETEFSADVAAGCIPLSVRFTNKSIGANDFIWDFGDGTTSTEVNPVHTYSNGSSFTVRLISVSPFGCTDTLVKEDYIKVDPMPRADFDVLPGDIINIPNYHFSFRDASSGNIESRSWDFGDNSPLSTELSPEHTYPDTGSYRVRLIVKNRNGCSDVLTKTVRITGTPGSLFIPNAFMPNSVSEELRTFRVKGSGVEKWHMRIFNKWGEQIWQTQKLSTRGEPDETWDGMRNGVPVPQGVYFWEASATFINGTEWAGMTYNSSEPKRTGVIHLIR